MTEPAARPPDPSVSAAPFLADLATWLWRLQRDLAFATVPGLEAALRPAHRDLDALWALLAEFGLTVRDPVGETVPRAGSTSFRIIGYAPRPAAYGSRVIETVLPEVCLHGAPLQQAEVIASCPAPLDAQRPPDDLQPPAAEKEA